MRISSLDGLRGLAAYIVICGHFSLNSGFARSVFGPGAGQIGVMIFFALSGFLMGTLYLGKAFNAQNVGSYFVRRVARVVPLYLTVVLLAYLGNIVGIHTYKITDANLWEHLLFVRGEHALWTVPVECQFYLLFPLLWMGGRNVMVLGTAAIGFLAVSRGHGLLGTGHFFILGILVSKAVAHADELPNTAFATAAALLVLIMPASLKAIGYAQPAWSSAVFLFSIPLILFVCVKSPVAHAILGNKVGWFFGEISYTAYLLHMPIVWIGRNQLGLFQSNIAGMLSFLTTVTIIAAAVRWFYERPAQVMITRLFDRPSPAPVF